LNSIEEQVLRDIGESVTSPDVFTDDSQGMALIRTSISDAIQELCMVLGLYTRDYHLPLLANRQWYRLNPDHDYIAYILEVMDVNRRFKLTQTDIQTLSMDPYCLRSNGNPEQYAYVGHNVFGIYPYPSAEGAMLILKCACIPKPYTEDYDIIYLREYLQRAAASFAKSEYYASRGDAKRGQEHHIKYLETAQMTQLNQKTFDRQFVSYTKKDVSNQPQ
jgi:hypothetical protein